MKVGSALLLGAMLVMMFPRLRDMIKNSPKGSAGDWMGVALLLGGVIGFVLLLTALV